jgi:uncharacterized membrane protein YdjX (TVP38/TMEM64 family)
MMFKTIRLILIAIIALGAVAGALGGLFSAENLMAILRGHPQMTMPIFIALHVAASLLMVPRSLLGIVAGAIFGLWIGTALSLGGATLGGLAGFLLARFLNAGSIRPEELPRIGPWLARVETQGLRLAIIARLVPGIPHTAVNYALGLSKMRVLDFVAGSVLGMVPTSFIFANLGASGAGALGGSTPDFLITLAWAVLLIGLSFAGGWLARKLD